MAQIDIPKTVQDITSDWLSAVMGVAVAIRSVARIGVDEGFTGGTIFRLTLDDGTVIAKLSPDDAKLRAAFSSANAREVRFYQLSQGRGLPVPECHFGAYDPQTGASALVIEDMGAHRSVPFLRGCQEVEVAPVVDALAQVHRAFWDSDVIRTLPDLALLDEFDFAQMWAEYPGKVVDLLPDVRLPRGFVALGDWLASDTRAVFSRMMQGPQTIVHCDAQVDNVLFGNGAAVLLDWQFMGKGKGVHDLAFFLISSLAPEVRRASERATIERYHRALGVADYTLDMCKAEFIYGALWRLFITAMATTQLDNSSQHRRDWRRADLQRLITFCEDHEVSPARLSQ